MNTTHAATFTLSLEIIVDLIRATPLAILLRAIRDRTSC